MSAQLSVLNPIHSPETPAARAHRLMDEARLAAAEQIDALEASIAVVVRLAEEIAQGGDVYPAGARELSRRLSEEMGFKSQTLEAIVRNSAGRR